MNHHSPQGEGNLIKVGHTHILDNICFKATVCFTVKRPGAYPKVTPETDCITDEKMEVDGGQEDGGPKKSRFRAVDASAHPKLWIR